MTNSLPFVSRTPHTTHTKHVTWNTLSRARITYSVGPMRSEQPRHFFTYILGEWEADCSTKLQLVATCLHICQRVSITCRRLPEDNTQTPKHVGVMLIINCVLWFVIYFSLLSAFVFQYIEYVCPVFRCVSKLRQTTTVFVLSVRLSAWHNSAPLRRSFIEVYIWAFYHNLLRKFNFH